MVGLVPQMDLEWFAVVISLPFADKKVLGCRILPSKGRHEPFFSASKTKKNRVFCMYY
jgi:hypothetical protein